MAKVLGPKNPVMPAFINIGQRLEGVGESEELKAKLLDNAFAQELGQTQDIGAGFSTTATVTCAKS